MRLLKLYLIQSQLLKQSFLNQRYEMEDKALRFFPMEIKELEEKIEQRIGKKVEVEVREIEEGRRFEDTFIDLEKLKEKINMDIIVEDN